MRFDHRDEAVEAFRSTVKGAGQHNVLEAAEALEQRACPSVLMEVEGTVRYINKAGQALLGWSRADLAGNNVKVLMGEPFASRHDAFLK